jgi:hypothetical protein
MTASKSKLAFTVVVMGSLLIIAILTIAGPHPATQKNGPASVTVVIDFGGQPPSGNGPGTAPPWNVSVRIENGTVFSSLEKASIAANFTFSSDWYPNFRSHRVNEIAGVHDGTDNRYWQYYVNGQYMDKGADLVGLSNGDVVRWEFRQALQ